MSKSGGFECVAWTWGIAALVGILTAIALWVLGGWSFMQGAFMGLLVLVILGALLTLTMCRGMSEPSQRGTAEGSGSKNASTSTVASGATLPSAAPETAPAAVGAEQASSSAVAAAGDEPGEEYDDDDRREGTDEVTRPEGLSGPRGGIADDLKMIKGIGPKMQELCNSLGFYHFDQIASWTAEEVAWVDANLEGFKGRVTRDNWVEQARLLAAGGETEFSKRVEDGGVY